ncbi:MAG: DUF4250 domain-containing protein [Verrucomicrobia bacterium]|nr:MAG: DUF4250 domain-containing protein [Verrucomicrobiota bacterium]
MDLSNYEQMDPHLLVGLVNTELRNHCDSLAELLGKHDLDHDRLCERLAGADFFLSTSEQSVSLIFTYKRSNIGPGASLMAIF